VMPEHYVPPLVACARSCRPAGARWRARSRARCPAAGAYLGGLALPLAAPAGHRGAARVAASSSIASCVLPRVWPNLGRNKRLDEREERWRRGSHTSGPASGKRIVGFVGSWPVGLHRADFSPNSENR
jgi:hypothetical protein